MPSDDRTRRVLEALGRQREAFRAAMSAAADELRGRLAGQRLTADERRARLSRQLGPFGVAHIAVASLAGIVDGDAPDGPAPAETLERCIEALRELGEGGDDAFTATVEHGGDLTATVGRALARLGRAFAAARAARGAGSGAGPVADLPFSRWNRAERRLAPPLVVEVDGADLHPAGLAEFADGGQKIALVVSGPAAAAPLVRLITPGTFVVQTGDAGDLERLVAWDGPGVAALLPDGTARFVHDPAAGGATWNRLAVSFRPADAPKRSIGGLSASQQAEELELLAQLATAPAAAPVEPATVAPAPPADPADRLAAWLLSQVDLQDAG